MLIKFCIIFSVFYFFHLNGSGISMLEVNTFIGLECYDCNSNETRDCAVNPGMQLNVTKCTDPDDKCVITIIDGDTHRGCISDVYPKSKTCPYMVPCTKCDLPLCNDFLFPDDRRKCYQCAGHECIDVKKSKKTPELCRKYYEDDKCFTDFIGTMNTHRGCSSDGEISCENSCRHCNYNGCNDEIGVEYEYCHECSYINGVNTDYECKRRQNYTEEAERQQCLVDNIEHNCTNKILPGNHERCYIAHNPSTGAISRGCATSHSAHPGSNVTYCYGDFCNTGCIDIKCIICDSDTYPNCRNNTKYAQEKECPGGTVSCFTCENKEGRVTRGCGFKNDIYQNCEHCYGEEGCNRKPARTCYSCTSTKEPNCAQWNNPDFIEKKHCSDPEEECAVTVSTNGYTVRGCKSDVPECTEGDPNCIRCSGSLCNDDVVPKDRIKCHQCKGETDGDSCNNEQSPLTSSPCKDYHPDDSCYALLLENDYLIRGCRSDELFKQCSSSESKCKICSETGCNNWKKYHEPTLSCIKCKETDEACAWGHDSADASISCTNLVPFYAKESCFIAEIGNNIISRGCTIDDAENYLDGSKMYTCDKPGCNFRNYVYQDCIQCKSDNEMEKTCADTAKGLPIIRCPEPSLQLYDQRGCYTRKRKDGVVIRGCSFDLNSEELDKCRNQTDLCQFCIGQGCNSLKAPSAGFRLNPLQTLWLFVLLIKVAF